MAKVLKVNTTHLKDARNYLENAQEGMERILEQYPNLEVDNRIKRKAEIENAIEDLEVYAKDISDQVTKYESTVDQIINIVLELDSIGNAKESWAWFQFTTTSEDSEDVEKLLDLLDEDAKRLLGLTGADITTDAESITEDDSTAAAINSAVGGLAAQIAAMAKELADQLKDKLKQEQTNEKSTENKENNPSDNSNDNRTDGNDGGGGTPPDDNGIKYRKEDPTPEPNNTPQRQDTPTPKPEEKPSTTPEETPVKEDEKEPTIIEDEEKVPETPSEEKPSTTPEPETPPSNNNSNNNQTNTGENSNNSGAVNNTPSTGGNTNNGNNNYYAPSNNGGGNYNGGGSSNAPATGAGTPNENASTTTPSAPESDAGINDNSGETLDVISIDKDGGKSSASTSSNDGGSVVPTILGVGVAGAAAVAGAKILHDKKKKENEYIYEEDGSTESDNSFANLESYTGDDTVDTTDTMSPGKYRAGSANNLVLEGSPSDIKIDESIADIPNQKEELE